MKRGMVAHVPKGQLWFRHPAMQGRIRKAEADIAAGHATITMTPQEAAALLDGLKRQPEQRPS